MLYNYLYFTLILCVISADDDQCTKNKIKPPHLEIKEHILCDYDRTIRPVIYNNATPIDVKLLVQHFNYKWQDEHLHWDPEKYSNVETVLAGAEEIWTPDLSIHNSGGHTGSSKLLDEENSCIIFYHKKVICVAEVKMSAMCSPDYRHYPFDVQNCTLVIGSWFHRGEEIDLEDTEVMTDVSFLSLSTLNPEWKLISSTYNKNPGIFKELPNSTLPWINFIFVIKRNAAAKFAILIVPVLVLIAITILTLWLDPTSSDRIFISVVNIPLHVMHLLNFQWDLPETGPSVPYLIQLMRNSELIVLLTLIETIIVRHLLQKTEESPKFLVNIFTVTAGSKIGQLLLFLELNPEGAAENLTADDSSNLVEVADRPKEWYLLGKVIDRLAFIGSILAYFVMFIFYVSN